MIVASSYMEFKRFEMVSKFFFYLRVPAKCWLLRSGLLDSEMRKEANSPIMRVTVVENCC